MDIKINRIKIVKSLSRDEFSKDGYRPTKTQVKKLITKYNRRVKHKNRIKEEW
jgi:hypothetical protein